MRIDEINGLSNNERAGAAEEELQELEEALEKICVMEGGRRRRRHHARKTKRHTRRHAKGKKSLKNRKH